MFDYSIREENFYTKKVIEGFYRKGQILKEVVDQAMCDKYLDLNSLEWYALSQSPMGCNYDL